MFRSGWLFVVLCLLAACGGGSSGGTPPPTNLEYPTPPAAYTVGIAIAPLDPTGFSGTVSSFSVMPPLPAGLSIDAASGDISGTPTAEAPSTVYTVTASNSGGSTTTTITLTVNLVAPQISYGSSPLLFTTGSATNVVPTNTGGAVSNWAIDPPLPAGLTFSASDGSIQGVASAPQAPTSYTVTARNSGGVDTVALTLNIASLLLDLGHAADITHVVMTPTRVLSLDASAHWVLWDYATASSVASGDAVCDPPCYQPVPENHLVDLAGSTFAVQVGEFVELRSAVDNTLLARVSAPALTWRLASDGSYLCSASYKGVGAWALNGTAIFSRAGNYANAHIFCAPDEVRIAQGPAGAQQIEIFSVPVGTESVGPAYSGSFYRWFEDGARFLTLVADTAWIYSQDGSTQIDTHMVPTSAQLGGVNNWFWTTGPLQIYAVGASASPAATVETGGVAWSNATIASYSGSNPALIHMVDLSGASPVVTDYTAATGSVLPAAAVGGFSAVSSAQWVSGGRAGVMLDGASLASTPRYFGYGAALSAAGGTTQFAVATATGRTLIYDAATWTLEGTLPFLTNLSMSADGSVLAANGSDGNNNIVSTYALPAISLLHEWTYPADTVSPLPYFVTVSADGSTVARVLQSAATTQGEVDSAVSGALLWSGPTPFEPIQLSPSGTWWTTSTAADGQAVTTTIYHSGVQVKVIPGSAQTWLTDNKLLQNDITYTHDGNPVHLDAQLYDATGTSLGIVPLPAAAAGLTVQVLGADTLYQQNDNSIWTVSTGSQAWVGPAPLPGVPVGAVAGDKVIFLLNSKLLMQPH
ncbi:MAG: putative Ig domain-containing protein [Proteobacteria bacterium]|nr:putative Ig domain-containing protein [Pseudomonadota bacterium]